MTYYVMKHSKMIIVKDNNKTRQTRVFSGLKRMLDFLIKSLTRSFRLSFVFVRRHLKNTSYLI
jgi:hypothetical protein